MKRYLLSLVIAVFVFGCNSSKNSVTGRSQSFLVSEEQMQTMAVSEYKSFLDSAKVINGTADAAMVKRVGANIAAAITKYYKDQGKEDAIDGYEWEYNLVQSNEANAWCMPGGKIVVYSGILQYTQTEAALAVVMGHEIAHAVAEHGRERMATEINRQLGAQGLSLIFGAAVKSEQAHNIFNTAVGIGSQLYVLKYSREQELEADRLGLTYCALGGYDPSAAVPFWQRMQSAGGSGQRPPEFLSTHPSENNRISQIQKLLPEARKLYSPSNKRY